MKTDQTVMCDFASQVESLALADMSAKLSELGVIFTDASFRFRKGVDAQVIRDNPEAYSALFLHAEIDSLLWKLTTHTREFVEAVDKLRSSNNC
tara:strand:- start:1642 stop:1923 length:282 start_codon:yes stop_codon:yes gene_type:complete